MATFKKLEQEGWEEKASFYDDYFSKISRQAIVPILTAAGDLQGSDLLDVCCGTGDLVAHALSFGANVTGIDFAPSMIEIAKAKVPRATFRTGDAEALTFPDNSFDVLTCAFGLWHLAEPDKAIAEIARVLKTGGCFVYTTWLPPEHGWDMFNLLTTAIKKHGASEVGLPPAPPPFRFADEQHAKETLGNYGFTNIGCSYETALWVGETGQDLLDLIYKAIVRTPMLIEAQAPAAQEAIKNDIRDGAEAMKINNQIEMRWPYLLVSGKIAS